MGCMSEAPKPDGGTVERFRTLMLPHLDAAYGYARWLTRDPSDAQDLAQEAMLRALRYFHAFRGEAARPWLLRIVRNTWINLRTKAGTDQPLDTVAERAAEGPDPEQSAVAGDRRRQSSGARARCARAAGRAPVQPAGCAAGRSSCGQTPSAAGIPGILRGRARTRRFRSP